MTETMHTWKRPVTIRLGGLFERVVAPVQARHILLVEWPAERTDKHKVANKMCLAAIRGGDLERSRMAFMEAAIEAKIFVE